MFQPRFALVATASVRRRLKIDAVDTSRRLLIISIDATRFIGLSTNRRVRAARWPHKESVNASLRNGNLPGPRFAAIVLRRNISLGEITNVGAEGNTAASRGGRRLFFIVALLAILAAGGALYWYGVQGPRPAHAARSPARPGVPVSVAMVGRQDVPIYLTGLGHRAGVVHRGHSFPGRRQAAGGAVHRRPARQEGRRAGEDRSAAVPGRARPGQGQEGPGPGPAHLGRERPRTLEDAGALEHHLAADRRPAAGQGRSVQGLDRGR